MGFIIVAGVFGAIWAGATQWERIHASDDFARGFASYELAVAVGALAWAAIGAGMGWTIGLTWERWHRRRRTRVAVADNVPAAPPPIEPLPPQPTLTTARLVLRPFRLTDAARVQELAGSREVADTTLTIPHPYADGLAARWIATHEPRWRDGRSVVYAVTEGAGGALVGAVGLQIEQTHGSAELGYWIARDAWNRGYATEAAGALIDFAFRTLDINRVEARHFVRNPTSGRVMQKLGMTLEGVHRQSLKKWGVFEDAARYAILRREWLDRHASTHDT